MHIQNAHYLCLVIALILAFLASIGMPRTPAVDKGWLAFFFYLLGVFFV